MKKHFIKITGILCLTALIAFSGCEKALDINEDPNYPSLDKGNPELLFPAAVASTAGKIGAPYAILGGIWSQFWAQDATSSQYRFIDSYNISPSDFSGDFNELFAGALNDYQVAIKNAESQGKWNFYLMATIMKAYTYQVLVDLYDQVPYSEAFQGAANLTPKYDAGDQVYGSLIAEINSALEKDFSGTATNQDVVFKGDMNKWVQFANTLKLKMYLRMVYAKPAEAEAGIKGLYSSNAAFLTTSAGMAIFENNQDKSNPLYEYNIRRLNSATNLRASRTFLTWLQENGDPRLQKYFTMKGSSYTGVNQGDFSNSDPKLADAAVSLIQATDPVHFISIAESYFLQAEARERFFAGNGAKALYNAGVSAAFAQYGLESNATQFTAAGGRYEYIESAPLDSYETTDQQGNKTWVIGKLERIIVQKWASLPGAHALEAFFEKNRTGYPRTSPVYSTDPTYRAGEFVFPKAGFTNGKFPKRLLFPDDERKTNPNTPELKAITENVWWDKK